MESGGKLEVGSGMQAVSAKQQERTGCTDRSAPPGRGGKGEEDAGPNLQQLFLFVRVS